MIWDVIVVGGGAAGLFCAGISGQLGKKVLVLDHADSLGEKIRISGGGRCNFTNLHTSANHFLSLNPHFVKSPLARYSSQDFINLVKQYRIPFHEKHQGQLFCDESAKDIIQMLLSECQQGDVRIQNPVTVSQIISSNGLWELETNQGSHKTQKLVIATGGLPVPAIGASDYALNLAKQFDIPVTTVRPALVPLSFTSGEFLLMSDLSGISIPVTIGSGQRGRRYGACQFDEDLLLTHKGLSGPAVLQASSYWTEGETLKINWLGKRDDEAVFLGPDTNTRSADSLLADLLPQRFAKLIAEQFDMGKRHWSEISKKDRERLMN